MTIAPLKMTLQKARYSTSCGAAVSSLISVGSRHTPLPSRLVKYSRDSEGSSGLPSAYRA
jgi:hypothetical protein